jgi:hypothetical protein
VEILYALSMAVFVVLFATLVFVVLRARSKNEKSLRELHDAVALLRGELERASPLRAHVPAGNVTEPAKRTEPQRREALRVEIVQPLVVKVGDEVVELDAETVARIEALTEDVTAGRIDSTMLRRLIDAGLHKVGKAAPPSGKDEEDEEDEEPRDTDESDEPPSTPPKPT